VTGQTWIMLAVLVLLVALAAAARRGLRWLRYAINRERETGHAGVRRRVTRLVGRKQDVYETVMKADTMPGYVWWRWTRKPRQPFTEEFGWAPTQRLARRRLRRSGPGRDGSPRR